MFIYIIYNQVFKFYFIILVIMIAIGYYDYVSLVPWMLLKTVYTVLYCCNELKSWEIGKLDVGNSF